MNELRKHRIKSVFRYTWPFYIISGVAISLTLVFIFGATHRIPEYKTLTVFVSGEVTDYKKLEKDVLTRFKDNELKTFGTIDANPNEQTYYNRLSIQGYSSADILILPNSVIENLNLAYFALSLPNELVNDYYSGYSIYNRDEVKYGVKLDKAKVNSYMNLPNEDCYMVLNAKSQNLGEYGGIAVKEHDNALNLVKDWGL